MILKLPRKEARQKWIELGHPAYLLENMYIVIDEMEFLKFASRVFGVWIL